MKLGGARVVPAASVGAHAVQRRALRLPAARIARTARTAAARPVPLRVRASAQGACGGEPPRAIAFHVGGVGMHSIGRSLCEQHPRIRLKP